MPITDELDLHHFQPREIGSLVPEYLEAAQAAGFARVRVVHGKGTGVLRERVHAILRRHPAVLFGAAGIERGMAGAFDRWLGTRWAPLATGGTLLLRVVALWSTAPALWWAAVIVPAGAGRLAAVALQRLGDVAPAPRGRSFVLRGVSAVELVAACAVIAALAVAASGGSGLAVLGVAAAIAVVLGRKTYKL